MVWVSGIQSPLWRFNFPFKSKEKVLIITLQKKHVVVKIAFFCFVFHLKTSGFCVRKRSLSVDQLCLLKTFSL